MNTTVKAPARDTMLAARSAWFASQPKTATLMSYGPIRVDAWTAGYAGEADFEAWLRSHDASDSHKRLGANVIRFAFEAGRQAAEERTRYEKIRAAGFDHAETVALLEAEDAQTLPPAPGSPEYATADARWSAHLAAASAGAGVDDADMIDRD